MQLVGSGDRTLFFTVLQKKDKAINGKVETASRTETTMLLTKHQLFTRI